MGDDPRGHREALEEQVPLREAAAARARLSDSGTTESRREDVAGGGGLPG